MTRSEVTSLFLKLVAIYLWVQALTLGSYFVSFGWLNGAQGQSASFASMGMIVPMICFIVLGALLFFLGSTLPRRSVQGAAPIDFANPGELGVIGLRVAAVFLWLRAISMTSVMMNDASIANIGGGWNRFIQTAGMSVFLGAVGLWLFVRAGAIAVRWFGKDPDSPDRSIAATLQGVAFSIVGLWILADAFPNLIVLAVSVIQRMRSVDVGEPSFGESGSGWPVGFVLVLRAVLGVVLFLRGSGLSALWHWIQRAGLAARRAGLDPKSGHV